MPNLADTLSERVGPLPAWMWAVLGGAGLYLLAHRQSGAGSAGTAQGNPTFSPFAGGQGALFGSPAALTGPVLQPNPAPVDAINPQAGAALTPNATYIPTPSPPAGGEVSGGDNPFTSGYVGLRRATNYTYARGGPS